MRVSWQEGGRLWLRDDIDMLSHNAISVVVNMDQMLVEAVQQRRRLRFQYNGKTRLVEPQCYGIGSKGTELLRAHQLQGGKEKEPLFDVSKMTELEILDEVFSRPGPNYTRDDSVMKSIFAQL